MRVAYDGRRYISVMNLVRQINENDITLRVLFIGLVLLLDLTWSKIAPVDR